MSNQDSPTADNKLPWSVRKHKGSVACYSDVVSAAGHPICCVHDDYAALIVNAVNNGEHLMRELAQIKRELEQSRASCLLMKNAAQELNRELVQAKEQRYPHWTCKTHGDFDARVVVGCPGCVRELRTELAQAKERLKQRKCAANMYSDPPQDCDAPYCGCNPAWSECIEMLQEHGWKSPDELRAAQPSIESQAQSETKGDVFAGSAMPAGDPPYMPSHHELFSAVNHYAREILRLTDAVPTDCQSPTASPQSEPQEAL